MLERENPRGCRHTRVSKDAHRVVLESTCFTQPTGARKVRRATPRLSTCALAGLVCVIVVTIDCGRAPSAADGQRLYGANGCATCHGPAGHGDGPIGKTLAPPPRDFRDERAFKRGADVPAIARTIAEGITGNGSQMPAFGHLSDPERQSLAMFVLTIRESGRNP